MENIFFALHLKYLIEKTSPIEIQLNLKPAIIVPDQRRAYEQQENKCYKNKQIFFSFAVPFYFYFFSYV